MLIFLANLYSLQCVNTHIFFLILKVKGMALLLDIKLGLLLK